MNMAEIPNDIPGNSHKEAQEKQKKGDGRPPIPEFEGETAQAKRKNSSFWRWFRRMFLSDRKPKDILKEIVEYRIVPGIKDNFRNSAMATLDSFIYPGSGPAGPSTNQNNVNYNKIFANPTQQARAAAQQPTSDPKTEEINKGFQNPCFHTQMDAQTFLAMMKGYDYPTLSVHTLYMMQKKHIDYTWDAYGWTREEILALGPGCIRHISGDPNWPWMINLPEAHVIA